MLSYLKSEPLNLSNFKFFSKKQKYLTFGPKMPYLGIFDQKWLIWVFLRKNFRKTIVIFEISTFKLVFLQNFTKKQKCLNSEPKMPDFPLFGLGLQNNIAIFEISTLKLV